MWDMWGSQGWVRIRESLHGLIVDRQIEDKK